MRVTEKGSEHEPIVPLEKCVCACDVRGNMWRAYCVNHKLNVKHTRKESARTSRG